MGYIYIITSPKGKAYIGQTIRPIIHLGRVEKLVDILRKMDHLSEDVLEVNGKVKSHMVSNGLIHSHLYD